jgi:hypothetical protein
LFSSSTWKLKSWKTNTQWNTDQRTLLIPCCMDLNQVSLCVTSTVNTASQGKLSQYPVINPSYYNYLSLLFIFAIFDDNLLTHRLWDLRYTFFLKCCHLPVSLHDVTTQKNNIDNCICCVSWILLWMINCGRYGRKQLYHVFMCYPSILRDWEKLQKYVKILELQAKIEIQNLPNVKQQCELQFPSATWCNRALQLRGWYSCFNI